MDITDLKIEMLHKTSYIPDFINTTSSLDHAIWNNMRFISELLVELLSNKIITTNKINVLILKFDLELEMIGDVSDKVFTIQEYYEDFLEYMLERCLEEEMYEAATNIRNFTTTYKNKYQF
jgi:hypothetical protein